MLDKIKIISYNTCWETTKPTTKKFGFVGKLCKKNVEICRSNIVNFINKNYPFDFISLQEVVFDNTAKNIKNMVLYKYLNSNIINNMDNVISSSVKNNIVTFYDKSKYNLKKIISDEIVVNRPYHILIFDNNMIFINIHAPHIKPPGKPPYISTKIIFEKLNNKLYQESQEMLNYLKKCEIIIAGDFNRNISFIKNLKLLDKNLLVSRKNIKSCCSRRNYFKYNDFKGGFDSVISTISIPEYQYSKKPNYPSSDHLPVIFELTNTKRSELKIKKNKKMTNIKNLKITKNKNENFIPESLEIDKKNFINSIENINNILFKKMINHKKKCDIYEDEYLKKILDILILFKKLKSLMKYLKCSINNNNKNSEYILKLFSNINKGKIIDDNSIKEMKEVQDKIEQEKEIINKLYNEYVNLHP